MTDTNTPIPDYGAYTGLGDIADMLTGCIGRTFEGYKGADYTMRSYTDVYIAEYGRSGGDRIGPVLTHFLTHQTPLKEMP